MKVTKDRIIAVLSRSLENAREMTEPGPNNALDWVNKVLQPVDDLIFDHYTQFNSVEADEEVLREVTSKFKLKTGPWEQLLSRLNTRVDRLNQLIAIGAPKITLEGEIGLIRKAMVIIEERITGE